MDRNRLIDALQATTSSTEQIKEATAYLDEVSLEFRHLRGRKRLGSLELR